MREAKAANLKLAELQRQVFEKNTTENELRDRIDDLNYQISEINRAVHCEQLQKTEITSKYNVTKGQMVELENTIDKKDLEITRLDKSIEELRAQVLLLQQRKQQISSNSMDNSQTSVSQRNAWVRFPEMELNIQISTAGLNNNLKI